MLFLCSGQVIEGCHHEQDMRKMGGLIRKMPVTAITFLIGVLAISGFGIPKAHLGLGGYFSKDEILAVAWDRANKWGEPIEHGDAGHETTSDGRAAGQVMLVSDAQGREEPISGQGVSHSLRSKGWGTDQHDSAPAMLVSDPQVDEEHASAGSADHLAGTMQGRAGDDRVWKLLFWCALVTAYVTPCYMMRAWWMTFMGRPRDEQVHHHAHERVLMWFPLVVLAVFTFVSSYFIFRPMIADAATAATDGVLVAGFDGVAETAAEAHGRLIHLHAAHDWLAWGVGGSWLVAFIAAIFIYRNGLDLAARLKSAFGPVATLLDKKYYFDELYGFFLVKGCVVVAYIARFFDTYVIDMFANLSAKITERFSVFSGRGVDANVVDRVFNGIAVTSMDVSNVFRSPQTGRIRHYVLFATGGAAIAILALLLIGSFTATPVAITSLDF